MHGPQIYSIGPRPLRYRALGGLLAGLLASTTAAQEAPKSPPASQYNHHSIALFNPLANVACVSDKSGAINGAEMIKKWKDLRVSPDQMMGLVEVLIFTQSPVVSADPSVLEDAKALSAHTYEIFTLTTETQIINFLNKKSIAHLEREGWLAPGSTLVNSRRMTEFSQVLDVWEQFSQFTDSGVKAPLYNPDDESPQKMAQALASLKMAVHDTGLNSLKIPLPMWSSSEHLSEVAFHLQQSNRELQSITHWNGAVLGLKEKVNLTVTYAHDLSFASVADNGSIDIQASFSSLAHEWEHALEYVLAQQVGYKPQKGPALLTQAVSDGVSHPLVQQWKTVGDHVDNVMRNTWYTTLQEKSKRFPQNASYYANRHEHMAYTFEAFAQGQLPITASLRYLPQADRSGAIGPTAQQARETSAAWDMVFSYLKQTWWNSPATPAVDSPFKNKIMLRRPADGVLPTPTL